MQWFLIIEANPLLLQTLEKKGGGAELPASPAEFELCLALLLGAQLRETVRLFAALTADEAKAVMATRQKTDAYALGRAAMEAAGYGRRIDAPAPFNTMPVFTHA